MHALIEGSELMIPTAAARMRRRVFGIALAETRVDRRGFEVASATPVERIEQIGAAFVHGYHAALLTGTPDYVLTLALQQVPLERRGFAFEGAAMGLALLDYLIPWRRDRFATFLQGRGAGHVYMAHVGAGWAMARMPGSVVARLRRLDPLLRWLAIDGYGFHEGYFHWPRSVTRQAVPRRFVGYSRRAFDQGLGRSLWFVKGADPMRIADAIARFAEPRHGDLWSGVGLAAAYAGGVERAALQTLIERGARYRPQLAQGAAFAAKTRQRAANPAPHTELACELICELPAQAAATVTDDALEGLSDAGAELAYELWRRRIQQRFERLPS